jgi:hypothetical protein
MCNLVDIYIYMVNLIHFFIPEMTFKTNISVLSDNQISESFRHFMLPSFMLL